MTTLTLFSYKECFDCYTSMYGDQIYNQEEFESFKQAFLSAWESVDCVTSAESVEDFCSGMTECWQLTQH